MSDAVITKLNMVQALNVVRPSILAMFEEGRMTADEDEKLGAALDAVAEHVEALEAENARLQNCVWRADYLAIAAQKLVDVERTHAGCSGIQLTKLSDELALYWKHAGGTPSARAALAGKAGT